MKVCRLATSMLRSRSSSCGHCGRRSWCCPRSRGGCCGQLYKNRFSRKIDSPRLFSREYDFPKTFSLTGTQFSGKTYFYTIHPCGGGWSGCCGTGLCGRPRCAGCTWKTEECIFEFWYVIFMEQNLSQDTLCFIKNENVSSQDKRSGIRHVLRDI